MKDTVSVSTMVSRVANLQMFRAFHHRDFSLIFLNTVAFSLARFMMMVSLGWMVLEMTDSPLSLGMIWATRSAPYLLFGMLAGAVADKVDRRRLLIWMFVLLAVSAGVMGALISRDWVQLWHIFLFSFVIGLISTFAMTARQTLVVDIVGQEDAMSSLSMNAVAMRIMGVVGGGAAGAVIKLLGMAWPFYIMVIAYLVGIIALLLIRGVVRKESSGQQSIRGNFTEGLRIIYKNKIVRTLMVMAIICEVFGFSYMVVVPVFARDILNVGVVGLGMFSAAQSLGGLLAVLGLASLGNYKRKGWLILAVFLLFGVFLVFFSQSPWYPMSLLLVGLVGGMAAVFDTMQHTLLQLSVTEEQRGRAMGIWQLSIGFGPIGHLAVGVIAGLIGVQLALSINGIGMIVIFLVLVSFVPRLRRA